MIAQEEAIIDWDEAKQAVEQCLYLDKEPFSGNVDVNINEIGFGFARIRMENNSTGFQLVPALILRGHRVIYNEDGSVSYTVGMQDTRQSFTKDEGYESDLLTINLIDGSVILQNEVNLREMDF